MPLCRPYLFVIAALLLLGQTAYAATTMHVIPRTDAEALVSLIAPLLGADGYVNSYQGKLILRVDDAHYARIQQMLGQLPDHPRTVTVSLRRQAGRTQQGSAVRLHQRGIAIGNGSSQQQGQQTWSVRTLSGHPAGISQGNLLAVSGGWFPALVHLQQGITVTPQIAADGQVRLTVRQRFDQPTSSTSATTEGTSTTLLVTPGRWQPLGEITTNQTASTAGLAGAASGSQTLNLPLEVRVEVQ